MKKQVTFAAGRNIAMKVPAHAYEATVHFYRKVLGFKEINTNAPFVAFEFGSNNLWIDCVSGISQAEIWLEVVTNDIAAASEHFQAAEVVRCDDIEPLPQGMQAFWVSSPASIIHLVCRDTESWAKESNS